MRTITTEITLDAPADAVWAVLTDFDRYHEWNPLIVKGAGAAETGTTLELTMQLMGTTRFRPEVQVADAPHILEWLGATGRPGVFDGRHRFELVAEGDRTRLVHSETFSGFLHRPLMLLIGAKTRAAFVAMNEALAARVDATKGTR